MKTIWWEEADWPRDQLGLIFLGRALQQIGKAWFGDHWTEREFARANLHKPHLSIAELTFAEDKHSETDIFLSKIFADIKSVAQDGSREKADFVLKCFIDFATIGSLLTFVRPKRSPDARPAQPNIWSIVDPLKVVRFCEIDLSDPASNAVSGDRFELIYVDRSSLSSLIERIREIKQTKIFDGSMKSESNPAPIAMRVSGAEACRLIASILRAERDTTRAEALTRLRVAGATISENHFNRVIWPSARQQAGLDPKARAGRKTTRAGS